MAILSRGGKNFQMSPDHIILFQTIQFSGVGLRFYQQVFVFGFFAIYLAYFAKFRSEAVPKLELGHVDGLDLIQTIKSGQKILLIETRDSLKPTRFRLFNTTDLIDGRILAAGSSERAQRMLCQDDKYLYLNEIIPFYAANLNNYPCSFQRCTVYSQLLLYRISHIPDRKFQSRRNSSLHVLYSLVFGYTGFLIYRTLNLSPNPTPVRYKSKDCIAFQLRNHSQRQDDHRDFAGRFLHAQRHGENLPGNGRPIDSEIPVRSANEALLVQSIQYAGCGAKDQEHSG